MSRRAAALLAIVTVALVGTGVSASAVPLPAPDPCDTLVTGTMSTTKLQRYQKCRFDRLELAVPVVTSIQTQTTTATTTTTAPAPPPVTSTVTAPPVTSTVTAPPVTSTTTVTATVTATPTTTPTTTTTAPPPPPPVGPPTGAGIIPYTSLANKGNLVATVNGVTPAAQVSFQPGTFEFADFTGGAQDYGFLAWQTATAGPKGLRGSGPDATIFQMRAGSSTRAGDVPPQSTFATGGTNPLYLMRADAGTVLSGFTLLGTNQGHLYNGLNLYQGTGATVSDVRVRGIPGDNSANPGETFGINLYRNSGTKLERVEVDGRNSAGTKVGASGVGVNFGADNTINDLYVHDLAHSHGVASYTTGNLTLNRVRVENSYRGLNFERCTGTILINQPTLRGQLEPDGRPAPHIAIASDTGSANYTITDPVFDGPKLRVAVTGFAGGARLQDPAAVKLIVAGVERPDLMELRVSG